jgi:hypothetical protein
VSWVTLPDLLEGSRTFSTEAAASSERGATHMAWYNWFSSSERARKGRDLKRRIRNGEVFPTHGRCALCGDPDVDIEPHSEDYSEPFSWKEPAVYYLCRACHRSYLHKRFGNPNLWRTHLAHVRRGGYWSDRANPVIRGELRRYRTALDRRETPMPLKGLSRKRRFPVKPWWERLTMDRSSIEGPRGIKRQDGKLGE